MSSYHVNFLKTVITKPLHVLRKDYDAARHGRKSSTLTPDIPNVVIDGIFDEEFVIDPMSARKKIIHRIFAKSYDAPDYCDIGWVLNDDVDICMLCRGSPFGMFAYKHHCKACGNIFCAECAPNIAPIRELRGLGLYRVCNMCFYGQEMVDGLPNRPRPKVIPIVQKVVEESAEEKMKKLKMQQQEEFQRNALERLRLSQSPSVGSSIPLPPAGANSPIASSSNNSNSRMANGSNRTPGRASLSNNNNSNYTNNNLSNITPTSSTSHSNPSSRHMTAEIACQLLDTDVDVDERRRRMLYFGELKPTQPTPGYVVKTKRSSGTKLFVNICSANNIPLKTEPSSTRIDPNKKLYLLVNTPVEHQNEKDGSYCVLYDVIVHPDELHVCALDATGAARARLNNQAMQLLVAAYKEDIAMAPKVLQITANYKTASLDTTTAVRTVMVPAADAFLVVPQIPAVPPPLSSTEVLQSNRSRTGSSDSHSQQQQSQAQQKRGRANSMDQAIERLSNQGKQQQHRDSIVQLRGSTILASVGDSAVLGVDRTLKAMVLPREEATRLFGKNFNFILDAMKTYEVNLKDIILYPEPGFVIAVMRQRPARKLYVNVTHHPSVGFVAQHFQALQGTYVNAEEAEAGSEVSSSNSSSSVPATRKRASIYLLPGGRTDVIPRPLPHVIGKVTDDIDDPLVDQSHVRASTVDVVVPSAVFFAALQDKTGDLREQLAKEVLVRLSQLHVKLSSDFQLLNHPLYMQTNRLFLQQEELSDVVAPVLNLTEQEKATYSAAFIGKVFKQGHNVKTWKERLTFIAENKLQYFDLRMNFKGEFNVEDCAVNMVDATVSGSTNTRASFTTDEPSTNSSSAGGGGVTGSPVVLTNKSMGIPSGGFGFQLLNYASGGQFLNCYVPNEYMRDLYQLVLSSRNGYIASMKQLIQIPDMKTGWLLKQGHLVKNWKRRFFVLNYGVLTYYEQDNIASRKGVVDVPKGKINLKNATVVVLVKDEVGGGGRVKDSQERLSVTDASNDVLIVQMQSAEEKKDWFEAIRKHILYANEFND